MKTKEEKKEAKRKLDKVYRDKNREKMRARSRERYRKNIEKHRAQYRKNRKKALAYGKAYRLAHPRIKKQRLPKMRRTRIYNERTRAVKKAWTARNKDKVYAMNRRERQRNPAVYRAHLRVSYALRKGKLVKPTHCECCKKPMEPKKLFGHHWDYLEPLFVTFLCRECHKYTHDLMRSMGEKPSGLGWAMSSRNKS